MFEPRNCNDLSLEQKIQVLMDERDIRNVLYRDCRAKSRGDADLMRTCFFKDAVDHHQPFFDMPFSQLADMLSDGINATGEMIQYIALQILIELDGDVARTETYVQSSKIFHQRSAAGHKIVRLSGMRMLDRLERRNGEWRIAERQFVPEWGFFKEVPPLDKAIAGYGVGTDAGTLMVDPSLPAVRHAADRSDPSYHF